MVKAILRKPRWLLICSATARAVAPTQARRSIATLGVVLALMAAPVGALALGAEEVPLPAFGETWHPLAGTSLHLAADLNSRFVCDFEEGASSSSGPEVQPVVAEGVQLVDGPFGKAVKVTRLAYPGAALIDVENTYFGFWVRPDFDPATDPGQRLLLQMGDGGQRSLLLSTNGAGMLVLTLSDDDYATACRTDISWWKRGEWHHVGGWFNRKARRLWLLADGYGVDSSVMYHNDGLTPDDLGTLYLGCGQYGRSPWAIDEVVFASAFSGYVARAHHDWMLGIGQLAVAGKIPVCVKPNAWGVDSNPKGVAGTVRTFGLECTLPRMPRVTASGLGCLETPAGAAPEWTLFNLQEHLGGWLGRSHAVGERILWSSSDPSVADVQLEENPRTKTRQPTASGRFEIRKPGKCTITARMGGRDWTYHLEVVDRNRPDLLVQFISQLPRYNNMAVKDRPAPGDPVEFEVHIANRGFAKAEPTTVLLRIYESGGMTNLDTRKAKLAELSAQVGALDVGETATLRFPWTWRADPCHVVASIATTQPEISTHNNERGYLTNRSRNIYLLIDPASWNIWHEVNDNHTGSFALEDWLEAQRACWDRLLRESVYPATSPYGVQVRLHIDALVEMKEDPNDWGKNDPGPYWDGGWLCHQGWTHYSWANGVNYSLMHEWGHGAFAGADLYSYSIWEPWFHVRDDEGNKVADTGAFPIDEADGWTRRQFLYGSSADNPDGTNGRFLAETMMNRCSPQLHEGFAGHVQHSFGMRLQDIWQIHRRGVPLVQNTLVVLDIEGKPIEGVEVAVYQQTFGHEQNAGRSTWPNVIKFAGKTDAEGKWIYPYETAVSFDDPDTDQVERSVEVASPLSTPRAPWPASPGVWSNNSMQLIGVRKGPWTEYHVLDEFQFAAQAYRNDRLFGTLVIQTNLPANLENVETRPFRVEPAQDPNQRPVVVCADVMNVAPGAEVAVDASKSYDPEGKPVSVHWILAGWGEESDIAKNGGKWDTDQGPVFHFKAPDKPCEIRIGVYCCDTVRLSEIKQVKIVVGGASATEGTTTKE